MGGAARTGNVHHLVLYEPSLGLAYPPGSIDASRRPLAAGDNEAAIIAVLVDILEMTDEEIDAFRTSPLWPVRLAAAPTVPRECRVEESWVYRAGPVRRRHCPDALPRRLRQRPRRHQGDPRGRSRHIPHAQIRVLDGHGHFAHKTDPAMVAATIGDFVMS